MACYNTDMYSIKRGASPVLHAPGRFLSSLVLFLCVSLLIGRRRLRRILSLAPFAGFTRIICALLCTNSCVTALNFCALLHISFVVLITARHKYFSPPIRSNADL
jgi:hypothetical protein